MLQHFYSHVTTRYTFMHLFEQLGGGKALHLLRMVLLRGKAEAEAF